jgi:hypothetical protein
MKTAILASAIRSDSQPSLRRDVLTAVVTGQLAGLIMAAVMMIVFTLLGKGPLFPVQVIGSVVFGDVALQGLHVPALLTGLVVHQLGAALLWSVGFGFVLHALDARRGIALVALAVATGLLSQIVDVNLAMPTVMNALHGHDIWAEQVPALWSWAAHLVFGLGLASFPWVQDRLAARHGPALQT